MSVHNLRVILFSSFLVAAMAPLAPAQKAPAATEAGKTHSNVSDASDIRQMQQALMELGYNPGEANGILTSQTRQSIREFQWLNSLPVTGNIDDQTHVAINTQMGTGYQTAQREKPSVRSQDKTSTTSTEKSKKSSDKDKDKVAVKENKDDEKDGTHRVNKSAEVLQDLTSAGDKKIPNELLERAEAIAVIPNMVKGAFGIGGRYGKGVVSQRTENGRWSAPVFIQIGGGSFGAQLGVSSTDLVLVFTDRHALEQLESGKDLKLGVDAGVAAGPIGRSAEAGTNLKLDKPIIAYSRSKGLFAGVALDGAVIDIDNSMNEKVYGAKVNEKDVLNGKVAANATTRPFLDALDKVMPKKRLSQK